MAKAQKNEDWEGRDTAHFLGGGINRVGITAHTLLRGNELGWGHRPKLKDQPHSKRHLQTLQTPTRYPTKSCFLAMSNINMIGWPGCTGYVVGAHAMWFGLCRLCDWGCAGYVVVLSENITTSWPNLQVRTCKNSSRAWVPSWARVWQNMLYNKCLVQIVLDPKVLGWVKVCVTKNLGQPLLCHADTFQKSSLCL